MQRRVAAQRASIGDAWMDFEEAAARGETTVRRAMTWARRVSGVALALSAWWAVRRLPRAGAVRTATGLIAAARSLGHLLNRLPRRTG